MDTTQKKELIRKAQTGQLTEEEYTQYLELIDSDPDFFDEVRWAEFLGLHVKAIHDEVLYEASSKFSMPIESPIQKPFQRQYLSYAAAIVLLIVTGVVFWLNRNEKPEYTLLKKEQKEVFAEEQAPKEGLGYGESGFPIGEIPLQWLEVPSQASRLSYVFCNDTLKLYLKQQKEVDSLSSKIQLSYESLSRHYFLRLPNQPKVFLKPCLPNTETLMR